MEAVLDGVEVIHGTLVIKKAENLEPLRCLRLVDGGLTIGRIRPGNLEGLGLLEDVTGTLTLRNLDSNLEGLRSLTRVGDLIITENPRLTAPLGLEALKTIRHDFRVFWNDELTSLHGLEGLEKAGYVRIDSG